MNIFIKHFILKRLYNKIGHNIRLIRKYRGMTQQEVANKSGVDRTYLSSVENGKKNISICTLLMIARALEVSINDLI